MRLRFVIVGLWAALTAGPVSALDPSRNLEQFGHTVLKLESGAPSSVYALAQTRDGYLWIGGAKGLYRFDGITFEQMPSFQGADARSDSITALLAAKNGELWVGHYWGGVSVLRDGQLKDMNPTSADGTVVRIVQTGDGAIWVASDGRWRAGLRRYFHGRWDVIKAGERGLPKANLGDVLAARDGSLWVALLDEVVRLKPGARNFEPIGDPLSQASALAQDAAGRIWVLDAKGVHVVVEKPARRVLPASKDTRITDTAAFIKDRHGALWAVSPAAGLLRVRNPRADDTPDHVKPGEGILSGFPTTVLEDREGDIWIGSDQGLDRLRSVSVAGEAHAPSTPGVEHQSTLLLPAKDGDFYTLPASDYGKLDTSKPVQVYLNHHGIWTDLSAMAGHPTSACTATDGSLWLADKSGLRNIAAGRIAKSVAWPKAVFGSLVDGCRQSRSGQIWISAYSAGMFRFDGRSWSRFAVPAQFNNSMPYSWAVDGQGRLLVSFGVGDFFRGDGTRVETLLKRSNIDIRLIEVINSEGDRIILGGEKGLMVGDGTRFKTLNSSRFPFFAHITGVSRTASGEYWIMSAAGLLRIAQNDFERALKDPDADLKPRIFDFHEGLDSEEAGNTSVIEDRNGRLWVTIVDGMVVAWIDPRHLRHNGLPPPVLLKTVTINGHSRSLAAGLTLPAGTDRLQIDYTATSLTAPERVKFRYRMDGVDGDWVDAGTQRQAVYTNLGPGTYRFKVVAANEDGVWNMTGATTTLTIPPTFVQSRTFLALCGAAAAAVLWLLYRLRIRQISDRLRLRHEARAAERVRIARELHDTLLQSVQGLIFRFQAVTARIPEDQTAHALMEQTLDSADQVVAEARDRVVQLRRARTEGPLPELLEASAERILAGSQIETRLTVEGTPCELSSAVEEEMVSIANEFMTNTLQHSGARRLDVAVNYGRKALSLQLCDDGRGIDQEIVTRGSRDGHFGLPGMSERARRIGAVFDLSSRPGAGVVILLRVPAVLAYARRTRWTASLFGGARHGEQPT